MYTIKQMARIAGITPRTLRHYDQIGLLKPGRHQANGYRLFDGKAVLRLQQILLYRALDMPLEKIREILDRPGFKELAALENHRGELRRRIARMEKLLHTVEQTIDHLKGEHDMSDQQLFEALSEERLAEYEREAMEKYDPTLVRSSNQKWRKYSATEQRRILDEGNAIYRDLAAAMTKGATSPEVQACLARWHKHIRYFWEPGREGLLGLADLYRTDPRFRINFDRLDPGLAEFMHAAARIYVDRLGK